MATQFSPMASQKAMSGHLSLHYIFIISDSKSTLKQMVADHLENNSNLYKRFLSQPAVVFHDPYNADTELPTAQDAYIERIADHELQTELRRVKYVQRLKDGAWGDHISIQIMWQWMYWAVNSTMIPILPRRYINYGSQVEVYIDLMQCHHVELDQIPMDIETSDSSVARGSNYMYKIIPKKMAQLKIL